MPDKDGFISIDQLIGRALDQGVELGPNPHSTIELYLQKNLLFRLLNGMFPVTAVERLTTIDRMLKEGKNLDEIKVSIEKERRNFLSKVTDLQSMVGAYKSASRGMLMLVSLAGLLLIGFAFFNKQTTGITSLALKSGGYVANAAAKPVGNVLAATIRAAKSDEPDSTDPLGLTNIDKVITINERHEVVIEKTIVTDSGQPVSSQTQVNDFVTRNQAGGIDLEGNVATQGSFVGDGSGLTNLPLPEGILSSTEAYVNPDWITAISFSKISSRPALLTSLEGVSNDLGNIDLVAGAGVTIISDNTAKTITFSLAGSGVNADLLDSINSTQFLRSDTSDNFTSGTLTFDAPTSLNVLGSFTCTNCLGDSAVQDTITASNYLPLSGGSLSGSLTVSGVSGLTDADIPNTITASNYLPLVGGTLTGPALIAYTTGSGNTTNLTINTTNVLTIGTDVNLVGIDIDVDNSANGTGQPLTEGINVYAQYSSDDVGVNIYGIRTIAHFNPSDWATAVDLVGLSVQTQCCGASPFNPTNIVGIRIETPTGTAGTGLLVKDQSSGSAIVTEGTSSSSFGGAVSVGGLLSASTSSTSAVGFRLNTAQAAPSCASLTNGDFGFDSSNNRIFWKGTSGTCSYWNRTGTFDIAEHTPAVEAVEAGDILSIADYPSFAVKKSSNPYEKGVVGVESTDPTLISNPDLLGQTKFVSRLALAGRVPTKVSSENGAIKAGDPITTSSKPGVGMKATMSGTIVGKALESFEGPGEGKILVLVSPGWYSPTLEDNSFITTPIFGNSSFESISSPLVFVGEVKLSVKNGLLEIDSGLLIKGDLLVEGNLKAREITTSHLKINESSDSTIGEGTLKAFENSIKIDSSAVTEKSKVFVTATSSTGIGSLYVDSIHAREGFTVKIDSSQSKDIRFNWLIIN